MARILLYARAMRSCVRILHASLWLTAAACTAPLEVDHQRVVGGTVDSDDPAIVVIPIATQAHDDVSYVSCTGTVIAPRVVVTAAHCIDAKKIGPGGKFEVFLGPTWDATEKAAHPELLYAVSSSVAHPRYDASAKPNAFDAAVLVIDRALPVAPIPLHRGVIDDTWLGRPLRLVGYGYSDPTDPTSIGTKRQISSPVTELLEHDLVVDGTNGNLCYGDSGGPALTMIEGKEVLVGVHSEVRVAMTCTQGSAETRIDDVLPFLDDQIAATEATSEDLGVADGPSSASTGGCAFTPRASQLGPIAALALLILGAALARKRFEE